jgi:hypothetical protein
MKRFIIFTIALLALVACGNDVNGQIAKGKVFSGTQTVVEDDLTAADTLGTYSTDSTMTYTVTANKADDLFYDVAIQLDSLSGTPTFTCDFKGKVFEDDTWTDLDTDIIWTGTSSDTTVRFQQHTTAEFMRYFQVQINGGAATGSALVDKISVKLWP